MGRTNAIYPSDNAARFQLRLPEDIHAEITAAAKANNRSMNSEIIARLSAPVQAAKDEQSLRDKFAGQALTGLIMGYAIAYGSPTNAPAEVVSEAFNYADEMLRQRKAGA